jgi:small subunit ribosomal protein S6
MGEERVGVYEATFLIGQAAATDLAAAVEHVRSLLKRAGAEVLAMRKWDERRLAYEIDKQKRGVFILTYFKAPTSSISGLERDCNLSETILRLLVTRADHLTDEEIAANDARQALDDEAKLRSEEAKRQAEAPEERVSIGAPVQEGEGGAETDEEKSEDEAAATVDQA